MKRLLLLLFLAGCAGATAPPKLDVVQACLPMMAYAADQEKSLGAAVSLLAPDSALLGAMEDYGAMRAANRACMAQNKGPQK